VTTRRSGPPLLSKRRPAARSCRAGAAALLATGLLLASASARADELGKPSVKITETSVLLYHFDNRDGVLTNDKYGEWLNRLNVQATSGRFTLAVRLDSALYFLKPDPNVLARRELAKPPLPGEIRDASSLTQKTQQLGRDLSDRFVNTAYPAKFYLSYSRPWLDATVGDFYAQLGRGFVLALRKVDELGTDTTVRGAKVELHPDVSWGQVAATLLAGVGNPIRVDDPTGRQLTQRPLGFDKFLYPLVPQPHDTAYVPDAQPGFATDRIVAGRVEAGAQGVVVGVQASQLSRETDPRAAPFQTGNDAVPARNANTMQIASVSVSVPSIFKHGSFYFEGATEALRDPVAARASDPTAPTPTGVSGADPALLERLSGGKAFYAQITAYEGPLTLSLEGKHYDRFYPLVPTTGTSEFNLVQYSAAATAEPFTNDTQFGAFNACVTGARARLDYRASDDVLVFGSLGRFASWSERVSTCGAESAPGVGAGVRGKNDSIRNDVWDPYIGFEIQGEGARTHAYVTTGSRFDSNKQVEQYAGFESTVYYREHYFRYDVVKKLFGRWSIQTAGFHRYRMKFAQTPLPWREGENYLSLLWVPKLTLSAGYEYTTVSGERVDYFSGQGQWRLSSDTAVRFFVGQQRQALRCISGVCRIFPAFEGARLELVVRL
jgi:hypothetical protein